MTGHLQLSLNDVTTPGQCVVARWKDIRWGPGREMRAPAPPEHPCIDFDPKPFEPMKTRRFVAGLLGNEMAQTVPVWIYRP